MNAADTIPVGADPFSKRTALLLVLFGALVFVALLWMIGSGHASGSANDGGGHAQGRGLNGFAAFYRLADAQGFDVRASRDPAGAKRPGLLVLTPPHEADPDTISAMVYARRRIGPTLIVLPKWPAMKIPPQLAGKDAQPGWVLLGEAMRPSWGDEVDAVGPLDLRDENVRGSGNVWRGFGIAGELPRPDELQSLSSGRIAPLVEDARGQVLAGYIDDGGDYRGLAAAASTRPRSVRGSDRYPIVIVAEPDLIDNWGMARKENAALAVALLEASLDGEDAPVVFDLTLNGLERSANLLTLAFTPPFLATTLCLLLAAALVGWRAFVRFGLPHRQERAIAFGKAALVRNAAGLTRRTGRLHLLTRPYLDRARERMARALALGRQDAEAIDRAIDRALRTRAPDAPSWSQTAARLTGASKPHEAVGAARELHSLERKLIR